MRTLASRQRANADQRPLVCVTSNGSPNTAVSRSEVNPCSRSPVYTMVPGEGLLRQRANADQRPLVCVTSNGSPNTAVSRSEVNPCSRSPVYTMVPGEGLLPATFAL